MCNEKDVGQPLGLLGASVGPWALGSSNLIAHCYATSTEVSTTPLVCGSHGTTGTSAAAMVQLEHPRDVPHLGRQHLRSRQPVRGRHLRRSHVATLRHEQVGRVLVRMADQPGWDWWVGGSGSCPHLFWFRVALLRRLRMPLPIAPKRCGCGNDLDQYGDHRGACATTGALAATAPALETAVARSCREAGGRVARNVAVANMNIASPITDGRRIEIVANGLQAYHGQQLAIDTTCVSPISRAGFPHSGTTSEPRRAVAAAVARKRRRYPELLAAPPPGLRRWSRRPLGSWNPQPRPPPCHTKKSKCLLLAARCGLRRLDCLVDRHSGGGDGDTIDGDIPSLSDLLAETRFDVPAGPSRLPPPPKTGWRAPETDTLLPKTGRRAQEMDIMRKKYCSVLEWADFDGENKTNAEADGGYGICCRNRPSTENQCLNSQFFHSTAKQTQLEKQQNKIEWLCSV